MISTAVKRDAATGASSPTAVDVMTTLNAGARDAARSRSAVHAATDVTGFGLLGHLREMAPASGVGAESTPCAVPVIDGVRDLLAAGMVAGGTQRNHAFVRTPSTGAMLALDEQYLLCRRADIRRPAALGRAPSAPTRSSPRSRAQHARGRGDRSHHGRRSRPYPHHLKSHFGEVGRRVAEQVTRAGSERRRHRRGCRGNRP